jgi:hypothetical protein
MCSLNNTTNRRKRLGYVNPNLINQIQLNPQINENNEKYKWETKWSIPWFDCDESLTCRGLNSNLKHFCCFTFIFVFVAESCLLVSWCAGGSCGMVGSDEDQGRSRRPGAEDRGWSHRSDTRWPDDWEVRWRRLWSAPCMRRRGARVSWFSLKTKVNDLSVVWPQNH